MCGGVEAAALILSSFKGWLPRADSIGRATLSLTSGPCVDTSAESERVLTKIRKHAPRRERTKKEVFERGETASV